MKITKFNQTTLHTQKDKQKSNKRKIFTATAAVALPTAVLTVGIGRNPAKAAKYLTGNLNMRNEAYKNAQKIIEESMKKNSVIKDFIEKINIKQHIKELPEEFSKKNTIFYHGTRKSSCIYKQGLNPYESGQLNLAARELGAGLYLTPNEKIAQSFTRIIGKIIPVKVENAKLGMIEPEVMEKILEEIRYIPSKIIDKHSMLISNRKQGSAITELLIRKIFTDAGYDGIYMKKGIVSNSLKNIVPDINKVLGVDQKQLVLYNTEKAQILSRSLKNRLKDIGLGAKTLLKMYKNSFKEYTRIIKNLD